MLDSYLCTNDKKKLATIIGLTIFVLIVVGMVLYQKIQYRRMIKVLITMKPNQVTTFKIYPRFIRPDGVPREFIFPDPLIDEFFQSLSDLRAYWPSHDTVTSRDQDWFLEIVSGDVKIQIAFHIPSRRKDVVVGHLGKFDNTRIAAYGYFQSKLLFQWYQKYKDRWLKPTEETK